MSCVGERKFCELHDKGEFYLSKRSGCISRNPATGEENDIPECEAIYFQTSTVYNETSA